MALPIDAREIHPELAPFQARLTPGELYRAEAVFQRAVEIRVDREGQHKGVPIEHVDGHPPIYRIVNRASDVQSSLTILYQGDGGPIEEPTTEVVLLGAVRTDQFNDAFEGFRARGYRLDGSEEIA